MSIASHEPCPNCGTEFNGAHRVEFCAHPGCFRTLCSWCEEHGLRFVCDWPGCASGQNLCSLHAVKLEDWKFCPEHLWMGASVVVSMLDAYSDKAARMIAAFFEQEHVPDGITPEGFHRLAVRMCEDPEVAA